MSTLQDNTILNIKDITHIYGSNKNRFKALSNINISIRKKESVAIMGHSGSGKSTLLTIMSGLMKPTSGTILFENRDVYNMSERELAYHRNKNIGFVFQNYYLDPMFTALENVMMPLFVKSDLTAMKRAQKAKQMLEKVGLESRFNHKPSELSGGECQRVAIARALVMEPQVIFADEPTGNLDSKNGAIVTELLLNEVKEGKTLVMVTHNIVQARKCNRMVLLSDGRLV